MPKPLPVIATGIIVASIIIFLEYLILPMFYQGIPTPFPYTEKPVGGILLPATFFHLLLVVPGLLIILYTAKKSGYNVQSITPSTRQAWLEVVMLLILLGSGMIMWWNKLAVLPFLVAGIYLIFTEIR
ncbi:hypothetical protein KEJ47_09900 [Candidatus Bathyarchaeota archaeon]|nr:hypothetical protein [Candidatus Bathyarchaeota archaeon]